MTIKKLFGGMLIIAGVLLIMSSAGTSDYDSAYQVVNPHPLWMLATMAVLGMLTAFAGYRLCVPNKYDLP